MSMAPSAHHVSDSAGRLYLSLLLVVLLPAMLRKQATAFHVPTSYTMHSHSPTRSRFFPTHSLSSSAGDNVAVPSSEGGGSSVRFLGKGERAIVRPGAVLVAPTHEYHHFYRQAAIFIHAMGEDDYGVYVVRGVIIDHPTPFTLNEMMPDGKITGNPLGDNLLFRGGDKGGDGVILMHNRESLGQSVIGTSGVYQGGWDAALEACANGEADVGDFKVFFNYCEFTEHELEDLLKSNEDGDCWASVEVESDFVLSEDWDRGDCWKRLRNAVAQHMRA
jgi:Uncharacterized ACR, COG1678